MKYILTLIAIDPENSMTIECDTDAEKEKYRNMAIDQGYTVKVEEEKE